MERFYKRVSPTDVSPTPPSKRPASNSSTRSNEPDTEIPNPQSLSSAPIEMGEFDYSKLPEDPGLRPNILSYPPNVRDQVQRYYLMKGPCHPKNHNFPLTKKGGADNFVNEGYYGWKKKDMLQKHVGHSESFHKVAKGKCNELLNQEQHIEATFSKQSYENRRQYQIRLGASIQTVRFLLRQGLAFRGMMKVRIPPTKSPEIQKDIANAISYEIISAIVSDIGDSCFLIVVDESKDVSNKEQMAIVLRHGLSISMIRGQGYDGANNMRGEYNGLKKLIMDENDCAYYIHCFSHQLQLAVIGVAKNDPEIGDLFSLVTCVTTLVGGSPKLLEIIRELQGAELVEALRTGELETGQGLNQETNLKRVSDTRWGSHHYTLISLINLFKPVRGVLQFVSKDLKSDKRFEALGLLKAMKQYSFVFRLHLMKNILGITSDLSEALQKKDQDIINAMKLVSICKQRLQEMRDSGWDSLHAEVALFCQKHGINIITMDGDVSCSASGRPLRNVQEKTILHKYRVDIFCAIIDMQLKELDNRFTEETTDLLLCVACLNTSDSFYAFDKDSLVRLGQFYPRDFSKFDLALLDNQLQNYIIDMRSSVEFSGLNGITNLARIMFKTKKDKVYPLVYKLLTLALILPVATASVERHFSAMKILKNRLRNRMGDEWMNDCLLAYGERDILDSITYDIIMRRFQNMKTRQGRLPLNMETS